MTRLQVFDCPSCGAPLPGNVGEDAKCAHCETVTRIETGGAAELKARRARAEAEAVLQKLGKPPSLLARIAVVLANPWVWGLGFPVAFGLLSRVAIAPIELLSSLWESVKHERLVHVVHPSVAWLLEVGGLTLASLSLLLFSLLGKRVDARRELQAALASKPPTTPGGKSVCRHCSAPLEVAPGALGARCASCGADNLVMLPARWVARAKKMAEKLRVSAEAAKAQEAEGLRRLRLAALWRLPMVLLLLYWLASPALARRGNAGWSDLHVKEGAQVGVWKLIKHGAHLDPSSELMGIAHCGLLPAGKHPVRLDATKYCDFSGCELIAMFALNRGERLHLEFVEPKDGVVARLALADRDYLGGTGVFRDSFGDEIARGAIPFEAPIEIAGWYKLIVHGPADATVEPCIVAAPGPR